MLSFLQTDLFVVLICVQTIHPTSRKINTNNWRKIISCYCIEVNMFVWHVMITIYEKSSTAWEVVHRECLSWEERGESVVVHEDWTKDNSLINATSRMCVCVCVDWLSKIIPCLWGLELYLVKTKLVCLQISQFETFEEFMSCGVRLYSIYLITTDMFTLVLCPHRNIHLSPSIRPSPLTRPGVANLPD